MVKNKHLLVGVAAISLITALICLVLLIQENKNGNDLLDIQEYDAKYSQETRKKLQDLSGEIQEHGKYSQETRKNLQDLEDRKVSELFSEMKKLIQAHKLESEKREKEMNGLRVEVRRLQDELSCSNGIRKLIDVLEKAMKKLESTPPNKQQL